MISTEIDKLITNINNVYSKIEEKGGTVPTEKNMSNMANAVDSIPAGGGGEKLFSGHYDTVGLKAIGWSDDEIAYYQNYGVQWNESEDDYFKLTASELAGTSGSSTRFLPMSSAAGSYGSYLSLIAMPLIDTSTKTSMGYYFMNCYSLITIPELDMKNVTSTNYMFRNCYSLNRIPQLNTSNVTNMNGMFQNCYSLIKVPQLDMTNVTNTNYMFRYCYSLRTLPKLNFSNVTSSDYMFGDCRSLTAIDFGNTDFSKCTSYSSMFSNCTSLRTVYVKDETSKTFIDARLSEASLSVRAAIKES